MYIPHPELIISIKYYSPLIYLNSIYFIFSFSVLDLAHMGERLFDENIYFSSVPATTSSSSSTGNDMEGRGSGSGSGSGTGVGTGLGSDSDSVVSTSTAVIVIVTVRDVKMYIILD